MYSTLVRVELYKANFFRGAQEANLGLAEHIIIQNG